MSEKIWKEISLTAEEQKLVDEIRLGGAGRSLPQEILNQYHVGKEWDMEVETRVGKTLVHMYWPEGGEKKLPLFINFHGGGFLKGRRDQDIVFCRNICSKAGVALADVDYIPAPAMRYPGQLYAGFDVLQYMTEHGEEWNINVDKIAVGGHSAGGSLTAGLVLKAIQEKKFVPALQIIDYAPVDMAEPTLSKRNCDSNPKIPVWKMEFYNKMYMEPEDMKDIFASPLLAPTNCFQRSRLLL